MRRRASDDDAHRFTEKPRGAARHRRAITCCRPLKIRPTGCSRKARCRPTSIRPIPRSTTRSSAPASCANSSGILSAPDRLRAAGAALGRAGVSGGWISEVWQLRRGSGCSWCRAIRRSACGCRSVRCPISRRSTNRTLVPADPFDERGALPDPLTWRNADAGRRIATAARVRPAAKLAEAAGASAAPSCKQPAGAHRADDRAA